MANRPERLFVLSIGNNQIVGVYESYSKARDDAVSSFGDDNFFAIDPVDFYSNSYLDRVDSFTGDFPD